MNRPEVLAFLAAHHWVASVEQLRELRVTPSALKHARRTGARPFTGAGRRRPWPASS